MKHHNKQLNRLLGLLFAAGCLAAPAAYAAGERESLETLRQTTLNLINVLVEQGIMTREKADALVKAAEQKAAATVAEQQKSGPLPPEDKGRLRIAYVPESVKTEIREQVRQEVLAQAKTERWGEPNALPEWVERITWEGDVRLRYQNDRPTKTNAPASDYVFANSAAAPNNTTTRAADFGTTINGASTNPANANTLIERERERIRARLGMTARVSEDLTAGFRLATGSTTDRVSTNQSMGQNFNKYQFLLDRAYLKFEPNDWVSVSAGRIPNPWFSTDLVWDENLNFEGAAATFGHRLTGGNFKPFVTLGAFPMREDGPPTRDARWLTGAQAGFNWDLSSRSRLKFGLAYYEYRNIAGRKESTDSITGGVAPQTLQNPRYGQYEYEAGLRQKGNTLFRTNADNDLTFAPIWGLASQFREVNLTAALDLAHFDPVHVVLIGDYVRNIGFNREEIYSRAALSPADMPDGRNTGAMVKLLVGYPKIVKRYEWNASVAYRYLGSDAVLDAFTSSDFGLGGTNSKGYILGFNYGIDRNASLGVRWLSSDSIDSMIPTAASAPTAFSSAKPGYSVDVLQFDLNAQF